MSSSPVEEDTVDGEDTEEEEVVFLPPPGEEENVIPAKECPDQESTFKDIVSFVRELYGLGPLKEVAPNYWTQIGLSPFGKVLLHLRPLVLCLLRT